jgi:AcrR family transcriptional regulator
MSTRISDRQILDAVIDTVIARGYGGATTREIATAAGINEVTLFRRFGDKRSLMRAAIAADIGKFAATGTEPTDDLRADLRRVLTYYTEVLRDHGRLLLTLFAEAARDPEVAELIGGPVGVQGDLRKLMQHHQRAGRLVKEPPSIALQALLGPLLAHLIASLLEPGAKLPAPKIEATIDRFLSGHDGR